VEISLIFAQSANKVIGHENKLPWHLPEDLAHFKALTQGQTVLMGRKTWDSLPKAFRPLPGRVNLVLSTNEALKLEGAITVNSPKQAIDQANEKAKRQAASASSATPTPTLWVIGGAQVYSLFMPLASRIEVTEIELTVDGDALAPVIDDTWEEVQRNRHQSAKGLGYSFVSYRKISQRIEHV
jgi:dihydrofolate reductase